MGKKRKNKNAPTRVTPQEQTHQSQGTPADTRSTSQPSTSVSDVQISEEEVTTDKQIQISEEVTADRQIQISEEVTADRQIQISEEEEDTTDRQMYGLPESSSSSQAAEFSEPQEEELAQNLRDIRIDFPDRMVITPGLPRKQAPGRLGKPIKLISNLYPINLLPSGNVYHYDIQIVDVKRSRDSELSTLTVDKKVKRYRCMSTKLNRKVIDRWLETDVNLQNSYAVYDGQKNLYTPSLLKLEFPYKSRVVMEDEGRSESQPARVDKGRSESQPAREPDIFKVIIKPVEKKDENGMKRKTCAISFEPLHELFAGRNPDVYDIQEAVMALETIFRHVPALKFVPIGRSFFHPHLGNMHPLGGGIEIWFGYHQSARLGQWKPMINLNTTATTFFKKTSLLEYFAVFFHKNISALRNFALTPDLRKTINEMSKDLKNIKIETTHLGYQRVYSVVKITHLSAQQLEFDMEENGHLVKKTVYDYFRERYNRILVYPNLPCVQVKPEKKNIYIPLEFCDIREGQHCKKELSSKEKSEMIKYTAQPPKDRFQKIKDVRNKHADYERDEYLEKFKIKVNREPVHVEGRELQAPNLVYGNKKFQPRDGSWNIIGMNFLEPAKVDSWCLLSFADIRDCNLDSLRNFSSLLCKIGKAAGINITNPVRTEVVPGRNEQDKIDKIPILFREMSSRKVRLVVVVIPNKSKQVYRKVKQVAEVEIGLITQCIDHKNVVKCNASLMSNVCQKINAKMGGVNHTLTTAEIPKLMAEPVIVMGADVSHPSVTDPSRISVAAVVGSLNATLSRFAVTCELQKNENEKKKSAEIILKLKDMVKNLLIAFFRHTKGQKPRKIIFYRDGVADGQFSEVKDKEVEAIKDACRELEKEYTPSITFAVMQKRHHVRFMPEDIRDGAKPEGNMKPGTVIDTEVVHPVHRDFYLCSHLGLKGTSRPGHYTILEDGSDFSPDTFQVLTHYLCHTFARCTKSISCPVPVRYAHLAAYRARLFMPPVDRESGTQTASQGIPPEVLRSIVLPDAIKQTMYFV